MQLSWFQFLKAELVEHIGLSKDTLHVYVGLGIFLIAAVVVRRPRSPIPWLLVLAAAVGGEALDRHDDLARIGAWQWRDSVHDLWNTVLWPTVLFILLRANLLVRRGR